MRFFAFLFSLSVLIWSCGDSADNSADASSGEAPTATSGDSGSGNARMQQVKGIVGQQMGAFLAEGVKLEGNKVTVDYKSVEKAASETVQSSDFYWESGKRLEKIFSILPIRLMLQTGYVDVVDISIPYKGQSYTASISKQALESFVGNSFTEMANNIDELYDMKYIRDPKGRKALYDHFVKVQ